MANKEWLKKGADGLSFGERLGDLIANNKTTATALAKDTGISQSAISDYQSKGRAPDCATIYRLAKHFSVSSDYLLGLTTNKTPDPTIQKICRMTGLTEDNVLSLTKRGPYDLPESIDAYTKLTNYFISYASQHHATRTFRRLLKYCNTATHNTTPSADGSPIAIQFSVVADIIFGTPVEGVDYAAGQVPVSYEEYAKMLLSEFLRDLENQMYRDYFGSDDEEDNDGID